MSNLTALQEVSKEGPVYDFLKSFYRAQKIVEHVRQLRSWPRWAQLGHRVFVGWRCPACKAFARNEHEGWGLKP